VKLPDEPEFMFVSKVVDTAATALAALSLAGGKTLTSPGG